MKESLLGRGIVSASGGPTAVFSVSIFNNRWRIFFTRHLYDMSLINDNQNNVISQHLFITVID